MYGLPVGVDFSFFVGLDITQICIGAHELILHFSDDVTTVTIEGDLGVWLAGNRQRVSGDYIEMAADAASLLTRTVTEARPETDGTLTLAFGNSAQISFYDSSPHYESYQILHGSKLYVI